MNRLVEERENQEETLAEAEELDNWRQILNSALTNLL